MGKVVFSYERDRFFPGFDGKTCKVYPAMVTDGAGTVFLTYQDLLLTGSDVFYDCHIAKSTDGGKSFSEPNILKRMDTYQDGIRKTYSLELLYHKHQKKWFGLGCSLSYADDNHPIIRNGVSIAEPVMAEFDAALGDWTGIKPLAFPFACVSAVPMPQLIAFENGDILVPFYYQPEDDLCCRTVTVRYAFGENGLELKEAGEPISGAGYQRGFCEPAVAVFDGTYYMTLRSDEIGMFSESADGLHFSEPKPFVWENGEPIGNYNTMLHWIVGKQGIFLAYTRKGAHNDHVFRHRAPLFMAQFDTETKCLLRDTETILVPELGARLGNFHITDVSADETWLVVAEWMQPIGCEKYGSDNTIWRTRILWK